MARRLAALLAAVLLTAGCSAPTSAAPQGFVTGSTTHALSYGGQAEMAYGWDELADGAKFVVAYPDGVGKTWNVGTFVAIGPDSATQLDECAAPHPTSVMHLHGTVNRLIRYDGGPGMGP